jgi:hypothetical protein
MIKIEVEISNTLNTKTQIALNLVGADNTTEPEKELAGALTEIIKQSIKDFLYEAKIDFTATEIDE